MGTLKALLDWGGVPLVEHQCAALLDAGFEPVVLVTGHRSDEVRRAAPDGAMVVHNGGWRSGRSSSLEAGAAAIPMDVDGVLVVAVDQPLTRGTLDALRAHAGAPLVQPTDATGRAGHPILIGPDHWPDLRDLRDAPEGLRTLTRRLRAQALKVAVTDPVRWDLNTPEAYRAARRWLDRGPAASSGS